MFKLAFPRRVPTPSLLIQFLQQRGSRECRLPTDDLCEDSEAVEICLAIAPMTAGGSSRHYKLVSALPRSNGGNGYAELCSDLCDCVHGTPDTCPAPPQPTTSAVEG